MLSRLPLFLSGLFYLGACTHSVPASPPVALDASSTVSPPKDSPLLLHKIAFGSCNKQNLPQPIWRKLIEEKPDLWLWTGDVVYADTSDPGSLSRIYAKQLRQPEYAGFLATKVPVIGIYDDHDYGKRDGGREFPIRDESKRLFLDFLNEPQDSPRRQEPGIYTSYRFGPAGKRIKMLLTDNRYNRDEPSADGDILGEKQWTWLEEEAGKRDAELLVVVSGTQVFPFEHKYEKWADWPKARARMIDVLNRSPFPNIIIISGDRHLGELTKYTLPAGKTVWEVTASGLTHSYAEATNSVSANSLRVGAIMPRLNYGLLTIDWEHRPVKVSMEIRDINKAPIIQEVVTLQK